MLPIKLDNAVTTAAYLNILITVNFLKIPSLLEKVTCQHLPEFTFNFITKKTFELIGKLTEFIIEFFS